MTRPDERHVRGLLAAALRGKAQSWPIEWTAPEAVNAVGDAAVFHGIAGLLVDRVTDTSGWPPALTHRLREQARAQAMWELRHRQLVREFLHGLADKQVRAVLLKGTAIAYDLYEQPAARSRGDSDLLVRPSDLAKARAVLLALGYRRDATGDGLDDELAQQEAWVLPGDGSNHGIDLHWAVMNSHALAHVLPVDECFAAARELPRLSPAARTLDRPRFLLHTCVHRAMHRTAPYFVDGRTHFDEGRLIWSWDIALLAAALGKEEWRQFTRLAIGAGVASACLAGLQAAADDFAAPVPVAVSEALQGIDDAAYLRASALRRAWSDLRSIPGSRAKLRYVGGRLLPSSAFMRAKYPGMAGAPLIALYARRLAESLRR